MPMGRERKLRKGQCKRKKEKQRYHFQIAANNPFKKRSCAFLEILNFSRIAIQSWRGSCVMGSDTEQSRKQLRWREKVGEQDQGREREREDIGDIRMKGKAKLISKDDSFIPTLHIKNRDLDD